MNKLDEGLWPPGRNLNQRLPLLQKYRSGIPAVLQKRSQGLVRGVATGDPQDLRWWSVAMHQVNEIHVFGHHDRFGATRGGEDGLVVGLPQTQVADRANIDIERRSHPGRQGGRQPGASNQTVTRPLRGG